MTPAGSECCSECGAELAAWERGRCGCGITRPATTREALYGVACSSPEPLHARDFARLAEQDYGLNFQPNVATTVLANDLRFCWGGSGIYGLYRHGLIPGPRGLEELARVLLVAAGRPLPHELLDYCLKRMGYRFSSASLRNAMMRSEHMFRDRYGAWDHRRSEDAERELRGDIRIVPERKRLAWILLRDAVAARIEEAITERGQRIRALADPARFGMNWEA